MRIPILTGAVALSALLAAACADTSPSLLPTAPSAAMGATAQAVSAGSTGSVAVEPGDDVSVDDQASAALGKGRGRPDDSPDKDKDKEKDKGKDDDRGPSAPQPPTTAPQPPTNTTPPSPAAPRKVELEGKITGLSLAARTLQVAGATVSVPEDTPIRHGQTPVPFSALRVGNRAHVRATESATAVPSVLVASEVNVQSQQGANEGEDPDDDDLGGTPGVSIAALDAAASEVGPDPATFRLTRTGDATLLAASLTATYAVSGTGVNGTDYLAIPMTVTFPAGQTTVDVVITPLVDTLAEGPETVVLTLTTVAPYPLGAHVSATVTIADTPVVTVVAVDPSASETGPDPGTFRFTRVGDTRLSLTVSCAVSGTAVNGSDYQLVPTAVTFPAGQATVDVTITPLGDAVVEGPETVILTVTDGATYDLGSPASATVTITG